MILNESIVEDVTLTWLGELGHAVGHRPHIASGEPAAERDSFDEIVLVGRLRDAIRRLNPTIPADAQAAQTSTRYRSYVPFWGRFLFKSKPARVMPTRSNSFTFNGLFI